MEHGKKAVFLILVAGRKQKESLLGMLQSSGVNLINVTYGKGAVKASFLNNILGLVPEENKVVFSCVTTLAKAEAVMHNLVDGHEFNRHNTGMAFTVPIEAVSYQKFAPPKRGLAVTSLSSNDGKSQSDKSVESLVKFRQG